MTLKLTYADGPHSYYLNGVRAKSVTTLAKIPTDNYAIDQWKLRQVAIGLTLDQNLVEKVAMNLDDRDTIGRVCNDAMNAADAHRPADRGTQMHRVLQLHLLNRLDELLTDQQRRDAEVLRRTLDAYGLTPHEGLVEQFVAYPEYRVTGRFDAVMRRPDGSTILVDLKSGPNAVAYPHSTSVQLALYAHAPHVSAVIEESGGDKVTVTEWRTMPTGLDLRYGYVLLVRPDETIGTLHEIDIEHGWAAAQMALEIVNWRKAYEYGKGIVRELEPVSGPLGPTTVESVKGLGIMSVAACNTLDEVRELWRVNAESGTLTDSLKALCNKRAAEIKATKGVA